MSYPKLTSPELRLFTAFVVFSIAYSTAAMALPSTAFMLQFGSFESAKEANSRIEALKAKHGGLIGSLPSRVVEVALPDNLTVYRTQSGPVPSRADAQSICAQLASNGDECYVVETAMVQPSTTVASSIDKVSDNIAQAKNSLSSSVSSTANATADATAKTTEAVKHSVSHTAEKAANATLSALPDSNISTSHVKVPVTSNIVTPAITNGAGANDAKNIISESTKMGTAKTANVSDSMPAVKALSSAPHLSNISGVRANTDETAAIDKKLAEIKTPDDSAIKVVEKTPASSPAPKSFWSRLNPFSSDDEGEIKPKTMTSNATTKAAIEETNRSMTKVPDDVVVVNKPNATAVSSAQVSSHVAAPVIANPSTSKLQAVTPQVNQVSASQVAPNLPPPSPVASKMPVIETVAEPTSTSSKPSASSIAQVVALPTVPQAAPVTSSSETASLRLPPPPPLTESSKPIFDRNNKELPIVTGAAITSNLVNPSAVTTGTPSGKAPFGDASSETLSRLGKEPVAGNGNVKVEEAQRVPLTQTNTAPFVKDSGSSVAPPDASIPLTEHRLPTVAGNLASPEVAASPSAELGKNVWAELGRFSDAEHALAFWDQFRNKHQDFPVVRVRITQTYAQKSRGETAVNLRVGPFSKEASLRYLCHNIEAQDIYCRSIIDSGASSASSDSRSRQAQGEATLANSNAARSSQKGVYWVQLGSYPSLSQAQNTWADLKQRYTAALASAEPNISVPVLASSARPQYRLRSGPYATNIAATQACLRLKAAGGNCLVSTQ